MKSLQKKCKLLFSITLLLTTALLHDGAFAQSRSTLEAMDARVNRIERVLDQSMLEQFQRVDRLEQEIRGLRGEIESLTFELNTLKKRNSDLYDDTDRRINDLEQAQESLEFLNEEGTLQEGNPLDEGNSFLDETAIDATVESGGSGGTAGVPEAVIVSQEGTAVPLSNIQEFGDGPAPPSSSLRSNATNAEKLAYNSAYDQLARGQVSESITSFDTFLTQYPDGPYSDNAWYWQGEAMYSEREFDEAIRNFGVVINAFQGSPKVPDARLKIGFALYEQRQFDQARTILTSVQDDYPGRSASVLARTRLQKMDREGL